jgi:hypothetical protein
MIPDLETLRLTLKPPEIADSGRNNIDSLAVPSRRGLYLVPRSSLASHVAR